MSAPAIEARELFRVHAGAAGESAALQGLTLAVEPGEVVVVLGPSGSGKSTLLRILAGLERPSSGSVRVWGEELTALRGRALARHRAAGMGYLEQHYSRSLAPELTAREAVALRLELGGAARAERLRRADELLERVGLHDRAGARPGELSGGEQQRVALCAAIAHHPRLLLADEPTGELDAASAEAVYRLLGELARERRATAVIVSHDPASAAVADRVVRVRDGRVSEDRSAIVVGRGGWLRLPEELLRAAGIGGLARAELAAGGIVVAPAGDARPAPTADDAPPAPAAPGAVAAELRAAGRSFGAVRGLPPVTASFRAGTLTAVVGRSGSGKSTLLRLLAALDDPTEGEALALGRPLRPLDRDARAALRREGIALVEQDPQLPQALTAREAVALALEVRAVEADAAAALRLVGLGERLDHRVGALSAGERQRVAVARAAAGRPALLLADEPTARLDEASAAAVARLLARLARELRAAVVCATHDPVVVDQADARLELD